MPKRDLWIAFGLLVAALAAMEAAHPYYFLEDDNRTGHLGLLGYLIRGILRGELSVYVFHQMLGIPLPAIGFTPVFYPPAYLCAALSHLLFGHIQATFDLLVALHLLAGCSGAWLLAGRFGYGRLGALYAALSWPLCSMSIYTATSWWNASGVVAFFPWLLVLALDTVGGSARSWIGLVAVRVALFYVGHTQFFLYCVLFEILAVAVAIILPLARRRAVGWKGVGRYALGHWITLALALPAVSSFGSIAARSVERATALPYNQFAMASYDAWAWLQGAVFPYVAAPDYYNAPLWAWYLRAFPFLSFAGLLTLPLVVIGLPLMARTAGPRLLLRPDLAVLLATLAVAWPWTVGALNRLVYQVPVLNRFRWSFKLNYFVMFALVLLAAAVFSWWRSKCRTRRERQGLVALLALQVASLAALYLLWPQRSFNPREILEQPPIEEPWAERLRDGRIVSIGWNDRDPYSSRQLGFSYASLWGLFQYGGYENLRTRDHQSVVVGLQNTDLRRPQYDGVLKSEAIPLGHLREWGVKWYILARDSGGVYRGIQTALVSAGIEVADRDRHRVLLRDPQARPLAFWHGSAEPAGTVDAGSRSISVRFPPREEDRVLTLNFLFDPGFHGRSSTGDALEVRRGSRAETLVQVPAGVSEVEVLYRDDALWRGVVVGGSMLTATALVAAGLWIRRRVRR